ncbi:hypothetical protein Q0590_21995 [Rhodocytophaga aerolata]|uniref:Uncharacterized protein n=1 Tax=Rhodocytophaga aerolata TaxID=455078 RepID=A0ABT8RA46_9BACT|nr:hypothetical protein [Rhodocytophaga aerolata]MDO1448966.1 hypothetical protein [Rhodocytophaga aerolata]
MKKHVLISLAACLLSLFSCKETEEVIPDPVEDLEIYDVVSFNKVVAGTLLSAVTSDSGLVIPMTSFNSISPDKPVAAMVFNSSLPHWEDVDLGTPNQKFGGKGKGKGGESGNFINNTALGNIVVLQNFKQFGTVPNDDDGPGYITFDFSRVNGGIKATSLTVLDVETAREKETGDVKLYTRKGGTLLYTATFQDTEANGVGIVDLKNTPGVGYLEVNINGSIAIDNLRFYK